MDRLAKRKRLRAKLISIIFVVWAVATIIWIAYYMRVVSLPFLDTCEAMVSNDTVLLAKQTDVIDYVRRVRDASDDADAIAASEELAQIEAESAYGQLTEMLREIRLPHARQFFVAVPGSEGDVSLLVADGSKTDSGSAGSIGRQIEQTDDVLPAIDRGEDKSYRRVIVTLDRGLVVVFVANINGRDASSGCLVAVMESNEIIATTIMRALVPLVLLVVALLSVPVAFVLFMRRRVINPIKLVGEATNAYLQDRLAGKVGTTHLSDLNMEGDNELTDLVHVMAQMESDVAEYEQSLVAMAVQQERVNTELEMATTIQSSSLPNVFPAFPDRHEFDIFASMSPAREVGGDFYDFYMLDDDHLCMTIADVSDKGIPAALFMMTSKAVLASCIQRGESPAETLRHANNTLSRNNAAGMFVTVWLGILEISTGRVVTANGGHEYPVLTDANGDFQLFRDKHGLVVGAMEGMRYVECQLTMRPGGKLFVYTDGLPEATNAEGEMFGLDHMVVALQEAKDGTPEQVLSHVRQAVDEFVGKAEQFDDLTMLCLEYKGME